MAEGLNLSREDEEPKSAEKADDDEEDGSTTKSGSKKVSKAGLGAIFKGAEAVNEAPKQPKGFDRLLEAFKVENRQDAADKTQKSTESKKEPTEVIAEQPETFEESLAEQPEVYELREDQLGGGEFVVNLRESGSAETTEIPLAESAAENKPEASQNENEVKQDSGQESIPGETVETGAQEMAVENGTEEDDDAAQSNSSRTTQATWHQQTQQQHQARIRPPQPTQPPRPTPAPTPRPQPQSRPIPAPIHARGGGPNQYMYAPPLQPNSNQNSTHNANPNTQPNAVDDAEYYGRRQGRREGLFAGLLVGGGIEHIRHKRREKRMEKRHKEVVKKHEQQIEDAKWDKIREKDAEKTQAEYATKFVRSEADRPAPPSERPPAVVVGELKAAAAVERMKLEMTRKTVKIERAAEVEHDRQRETLDVPAGHRVERSAWHTVELDEHGRPVENSALEYGREYYRERAHEAPPDKTILKTMAAGAAMAGLTSSGSTSANDTDSYVQGSGRTAEPPAPTPSGSASAKNTLKTIASPPTTPTGTIIWGVILLTILIVLTIVIL